MAEDQQTILSQKVEREVRYVIGDLTMQTIVLRQLLETAQQQPAQPQPQPSPPRPNPAPQPSQPGTPHPPRNPADPDPPPQRGNGQDRAPLREV